MSTALIFGALFTLFSVIGFLFGGVPGLLMMLGAVAVSLFTLSRTSPKLLLHHLKAKEFSPHGGSRIMAILIELAKWAELETLPRLFYIPSSDMIAFAAGHSRRNACIAISDGILRHCSDREIAGILAHEVSHIKNKDTFVMGLADAFTRMTSMLSPLGLFLLLISLPWFFIEGETLPLWWVVLLLLAPTASALLQLALSRTREYHADLDAVALTGDPRGLASALRRVDYAQRPFGQRIFVPYRRRDLNDWIRTHPPTEERVNRLLALV